jgi:hypothetical protein
LTDSRTNDRARDAAGASTSTQEGPSPSREARESTMGSRPVRPRPLLDSESRRTPGLEVKPSNISLIPQSITLDLPPVPPRQRPARDDQQPIHRRSCLTTDPPYQWSVSQLRGGWRRLDAPDGRRRTRRTTSTTWFAATRQPRPATRQIPSLIPSWPLSALQSRAALRNRPAGVEMYVRTRAHAVRRRPPADQSRKARIRR